MLTIEFESVSLKGAFSTEPLIDHNPKGVLITGRTRMALDLLRSHVIGRSTNTLCALQGSGSGLSNCGDAKVTDQDLTLLPNQEILRFLISRWITRSSWAYWRASAICLTYCTINGKGTCVPAGCRCRNVPL